MASSSLRTLTEHATLSADVLLAHAAWLRRLAVQLVGPCDTADDWCRTPGSRRSRIRRAAIAYRVELELYEKSGAFASGTPLPLAAGSEIVVADGAAEQIFDVDLGPEALATLTSHASR